jgi:ferrous iron transport protein A
MALPTELPAPGDDAGDGVPLSSLAPGSRAIVLAIDAAAPELTRLRELGFLPGTEVRAIRRAPLGDPIAFALRGSQVCLRRAQAAHIRVARIADEIRS